MLIPTLVVIGMASHVMATTEHPHAMEHFFHYFIAWLLIAWQDGAAKMKQAVRRNRAGEQL